MLCTSEVSIYIAEAQRKGGSHMLSWCQHGEQISLSSAAEPVDVLIKPAVPLLIQEPKLQAHSLAAGRQCMVRTMACYNDKEYWITHLQGP